MKMLRHVFLLLLAPMAGEMLHAQTVYSDCVDGVVYFKVLDTSSVTISFANPPSDLAAVISAYNISNIIKPFRVPDLSMQKIYKLTFPNFIDVDNIVGAISALPYIEYAEKAPLYQLNFTPNDYNSSVQWSLQKIGATSAWNISTGSPVIKVAIVDNGVAHSHVDLVANRWSNPGEVPGNGFDDDLNGYIDDEYGYDIADNDGNPMPPTGTLNSSAFTHGTHCAGIAAAVTNNGTGIASIGSHVKFISVKCATDASSGSTLTNAYEGVDYAISVGANVVSMSFGATSSSVTWQYVINSAQVHNVILVAAAGNDGASTPYYPASFPYVISVGATDNNDLKPGFSNYGTWVDVMAPGVYIYSTFPENNNTYGYLSGTSMATPLVAGLAALVLSVNLNFTESQVENFIRNGCVNIDGLNPTYAGQMGSGRINAAATMVLASGTAGIAEALPEQFSVFPNPSNGQIFIQPAANGEPVTVFVYNMQGKLVKTEAPLPVRADGTMEIDLRGLVEPGEYLLEFVSGKNAIGVKRLVIEKD